MVDLDQGGRIPQGERVALGPTLGWKLIDKPIDVEYAIAREGAVIGPGFKLQLQMPEWLYIYSWAITSDEQGSIAFKVYRQSYTDAQAQNPLVVPGNIINGTDPPVMTNAYFAEHILGDVTSWDRNLDQNDFVGIEVDGVSSIQRCSLILRCMTLKGVW